VAHGCNDMATSQSHLLVRLHRVKVSKYAVCGEGEFRCVTHRLQYHGLVVPLEEQHLSRPALEAEIFVLPGEAAAQHVGPRMTR
jgi:hypothetical protein